MIGPQCSTPVYFLSLKASNLYISPETYIALGSALSLSRPELFAREYRSQVSAVVFDRSETSLVVGNMEGDVEVIDIDTGNVRYKLKQDGYVWGIDLSRDGNYLLSCGDTTLKVWSYKTGTLVMTQKSDDKFATCVFSADSNYVFAGTETGNLDVWTSKGKNIATMKMKEPLIKKIMIVNDPGMIFVVTKTEVASWIWRSEKLALRRVYTQGTQINDAALSVDAQMLATAGSDGKMRVWDINRTEPRLILSHDDEVQAVAFSPDGQLIASASLDGSARLWDAKSGQELARLSGSANSPLTKSSSAEFRVAVEA